MKKYLWIIIGMMLLSSCQEKAKKWEYKTISVNTSVVDGPYIIVHPHADPVHLLFNLQDSLNTLGQEGWELVNTIELVGTTFPNFGDDKYVTGIRGQVATRTVQFVFKREFTGKTADNKKEKELATEVKAVAEK